MIFQEPMTALNPVMTSGEQIMEVILEHENVSRKAARERSLTLLEQVRISDPKRRFSDYPHNMSGGMRQRVMIAMALACSPAVIVADEPTTALDVTIQAHILALLDELRRQHGTSILFVTHDLELVAGYADRVMVMYSGRKIEEGKPADIFSSPVHPYTMGLLAARPKIVMIGDKLSPLREIFGNVPSLEERPKGCSFAPRCSLAQEICRDFKPEFIDTDVGGYACFFAGVRYEI
jgi:peptide/nickel transport system ATP-binding protein